MATSVKLLNVFNGTITTAATSVYVPTSPKSGLVTSIVLSSTATPTVTLELTGGTATSLVIDKRVLGTAPITLSDVFTIGAGEKLEIKATASSNVQFVVMGIERD